MPIASDIMTRDVKSVKQTMTATEFAEFLSQTGFSGAPVASDDGTYLGLVLEESLILKDKKVHLPTFFMLLDGSLTFGERRFEQELKKMAASTVNEMMDKSAKTIQPSTPVDEIATMMIEKRIHYFPVLDGSRLVGVVTKKDIVKAMARKRI